MSNYIKLVRSFLFLVFTCLVSGGLFAQGALEKVSVFSPSLEGNLNGDDPNRDVYVYLPPGYEDSQESYPVVYFLHGYAVGAQVYVENVLNLPASADTAMGAGAEPVILVLAKGKQFRFRRVHIKTDDLIPRVAQVFG